MREEHKYAIIGLGLFGQTLSRQLSQGGAQVIAVDWDEKLVQEIADEVAHAVALDATDEKAMRDQGIDSVDVAIVAIGENFEGNILCTLILKQTFKIKHVITRAMTMAQYKILELMDVQVLQPERESAERLSRTLLRPGLIDNIQLGEDVNLVQIKAPARFHGKALRDLNIRNDYNCNVVSVQKVVDGQEIMIGVPDPDEQIADQDILYLIGSESDIQKLMDDSEGGL